MPVTDLVEAYIEFVIGRNEPERYEEKRPGLFAHYHTFWSKQRPYARDLDVTTLRQKRERVESQLLRVLGCYAAKGLDAAQFEVVLFVGHGTTNGHAMRENGRVVVWIPVETYDDPLYTDVFLTHEVAHALHYARTPAFYFETPEEKDRMSRTLITEGLATYLTSVVLGCTETEALWGGYLTPDALAVWMDQSERRCPEMCALLARTFTDTTPDPGLFCLYDTNDVCRSRGGYFVGFRLMHTLGAEQGLAPVELLSMDRCAFEDLILRRVIAEGA